MKSRLLRSALALVLACGLVVPTTPLAALADGGDSAVGALSDMAAAAGAIVSAADGSGPSAAPASATEWDTPANCHFQILGGTAGTDYSFESNILHIKSSTPLTVKMADGVTSTAQTIDIDAGVKADLTLAGVNIATTVRSPINMITNSMDTASGAKATHADQIRNKTMLHLTIADGTTNNLLFTRTDEVLSTGWPGIRCGWGSILVIDDSITNIKAGGSKFNLDDIVIPENGMIGSDVTLLGGTSLKAGDAIGKMESPKAGVLVAQGGLHSAGIGSGPSENAGTLVINGGDITARMSNPTYDFNGSGIGGGGNGSGTVITINGGKVAAYGAGCGTAIGAGFGYHSSSHNGSTFKDDAIGVPTSINSYELSQGYSFWGKAGVPYTYSADGVNDLAGSTVQTGSSTTSFTVAGDITINGGYVYAKSGIHGNAIGQSCGHGPNTNRGHIIRITGGTVKAESQSPGSTNPYMFGIGARLGYTIVTGGSVQVQTGTSSAYNGKVLFQGLGGTAYNTLGVTTWDDVVSKAGGDPVSNTGYTGYTLPDEDKVQMVQIDLSEDVKVDGAVPDKVVVSSWKLEIDNFPYDYGAPTYLDNGKAYVWVPASATGKKVTVNMSYLDADGKEHVLEPLYVEEVGSAAGSTLKRYIDIDVEKLPAEQQAYFKTLTKEYDGLILAPFDISKNPINTEGFEAEGKTLDDPDAVDTTYQAYDSKGGKPLGEAVTGSSNVTMPADTGIYSVQFISKQYATGSFGNSYWGHRISGWAEITPVPAVLDFHGVEWGYLDVDAAEGSAGAWQPITKDQDAGGIAGNRLKLTFDVRSANTTALTCAAPTGYFQVKIDGKDVGDPIPLTEAAMEESPHSSLAYRDVQVDAASGGTETRHATSVTYYLDPANRDGLLELLEQAGDGEQHTVNIEYIADKNYIQGVDKNPDNAKNEDTFIVPVPPEGDVQPDPEDEDKVTIETSPDPEPGPGGTDPDDPTGKMTVVRKTITASYGDFHSADAADFFRLAVTSTSSAAGAWSVSNAAVADLVRGEDGAPALGEDGKVQIKVNSCGTSVIVLEQKANALYTGIKYILTVNILPDPGLKPKVQIRLTWRNLTALGEAAGEPAALMARGLAALAAGEGEAFAASARTASDRSATPPRPGDVIEYTVTGLNLTPGSAWQAAELADAIDSKLAFDAESVEIAANYPTHSDKYDLGTAAFYEGFDWDGLAWSDVAKGDYTFSAPTLTKGVGTVYGGQSTSVRFRAAVAEDQDLGKRPEDGKLPEIGNEPAGSGGYGKDEEDLKPGEEAVPPTDLVPGVDIVVVGDGDPDPATGEFPDPEPTPVLPKDPAAGSISTTVKVEQKEHREEHGDDRILVGDVLEVTVTSENTEPDSKLADAVVKATLPEGMEPKPGTIKLKDAQGNVHDVPDSAYDPKTGVIAVNAGDLYGGEKVELVFDVEVTSTSDTRDPSDPDNPDNPGTRPSDPPITGGTLGTTPTDEWEREHPTDPGATPDEPYEKPEPGTPFEPTKPWEEIEDELVSTPPASDPDMPPVLPASPKLEDDEAGPADVKVAKTAENLTRDDGTTAVGDTVRYTVTLSNSGPHTMWYGAVVRDVLPLGVDPLSGTIRLVAPDGSECEVPDSAYDPATRVLAVTAGDLAGGRTAVLTFECEVTADAVGADIGNVASAHGTTPAGVDLGTVGEGAERPAPGEPFDPSEGWDAFLEEHPGVDNSGEPAYAPGTDASGGVLAEAPGSGDGSGNGDGPGGGDGSKDGSGKTRIRLAQTGDMLLAAAVPLALAALAAGAVVAALVARRRRWDEDGSGRW
ncbi:hypothetical protein [uncultured Adlercreutzia sp.]|uniref:hypothetical protein n=1 Tax=uncultured Adlercreutzia sp. TaxID=875803 RepID=UPI0026768E4C|nr:hypothetical protein [uncultured Adlercreutzia sp.]